MSTKTREITVNDETIKRLKNWYEEGKAYYNENIGSWANKDVSCFEDSYIFIQKVVSCLKSKLQENKNYNRLGVQISADIDMLPVFLWLKITDTVHLYKCSKPVLYEWFCSII